MVRLNMQPLREDRENRENRENSDNNGEPRKDLRDLHPADRQGSLFATTVSPRAANESATTSTPDSDEAKGARPSASRQKHLRRRRAVGRQVSPHLRRARQLAQELRKGPGTADSRKAKAQALCNELLALIDERSG